MRILKINQIAICIYSIFLCISNSQATEKESLLIKNFSQFKNILIIGWDGVERSRVLTLLEQKKLPQLQSLIDKGQFVNEDINDGMTETKPGWAQILSGYNTYQTGVLANYDYRPIPRGWTVFERLREKYHDKINLFMITGKADNVSARGPHRICMNCEHRDPSKRNYLNWATEPFNAPTKKKAPAIIINMRGEPFFNAKKDLNAYQDLLGSEENVLNKTLELLENYQKKPFLGFVHFREPDESGHLTGEGSKEYLEDIEKNDQALGKILKKLNELQIADQTIIFVVSDHGFDRYGYEHDNAPETFIAVNLKEVYPIMDRRDLTPTILELFNIDAKDLAPKLEGKSLLITEKTKHKIDIPSKADTLRIGYIDDERTFFLLSKNKKTIDKKIPSLAFFTMNPDDGRWVLTPKGKITAPKSSNEIIKTNPIQGNLNGTPSQYINYQLTAPYQVNSHQLVDLLLRDDIDVATMDETSFIKAKSMGLPLVAIAELGHENPDKKRFALYLSSQIKLNTSDDLKNIRFSIPRTPQIYAVFFRDYLEQIGIKPNEITNYKIKLTEELNERTFLWGLKNGRAKAFFYDKNKIKSLQNKLPTEKLFHQHGLIDIAKPEMSQLLLVTTKDKLVEKRNNFKSLLKSYIQDVKAKSKNDAPVEYQNSNFRPLPIMNKELLDEYTKLLIRFEKLNGPVDLSSSVDNSLLFEIQQEANLKK